MEAGLEHLGRGTAEGVDCMLVVSDANAKSLDTAGKIAAMACDFGIPETMLVGNRIETSSQKSVIQEYADRNGLQVAGYVPFDPAVVEAGIAGESLLSIAGSLALEAIEKIGWSIKDNCHAGKANHENKKLR
jgi:CO dehydrogenase maturation factor